MFIALLWATPRLSTTGAEFKKVVHHAVQLSSAPRGRSIETLTMLAVFAERIYVVSAVPAKEEAAADGQ